MLVQKKSITFAAAKDRHGVVVQLVRIPACHAGGRGFESRPYRNEKRDNIQIIPFSIYNTRHIKQLSFALKKLRLIYIPGKCFDYTCKFQ